MFCFNNSHALFFAMFIRSLLTFKAYKYWSIEYFYQKGIVNVEILMIMYRIKYFIYCVLFISKLKTIKSILYIIL